MEEKIDKLLENYSKLKDDVFSKMDENKVKLEEKMDSIKTDLNSMKGNININTKKIEALDDEVKNVTVEMETIRYRVEQLEASKTETNEEGNGTTYSDVIKKPATTPIPHNISKETKVLDEAKKVIGLYPITDRDIDHIISEGSSKHDALRIAALEFLRDELKITKDDIDYNEIIKVTRPKKVDTNRLYIHFSSQEPATLLLRPSAQISNEEIKVSQFIPPQLFKRFNSLSKNTYEARQKNKELKTQIRLGDNDLILLVKIKGDDEWEREYNLSEMGEIEQPEWHKIWPVPSLPTLTSPPKGRSYKHKNIHKLSTDSENAENDPKKKKPDNDKDDKEDTEKDKDKEEKDMEKYEKDMAVADSVSVARMASIFSKNTKKDSTKKDSKKKNSSGK